MADPTLRPGHVRSEAHVDLARANTLPLSPPRNDPHSIRAQGNTLAPGQSEADAHSCAAGGNPLLRPDHPIDETHSRLVGAQLLVIADVLDDLERTRIAAAGRLRSLVEVKGMESHVEGGRLLALVERVTDLEHDCEVMLRRTMRTHPLGGWVRATVGVGEKQAGRLLAATGDPAERPNVAKLWQYCGHGDPARSHCRRGKPVEHSPVAKMRTRLVAESCIKHAHSPYRSVYDEARSAWAGRDTTDMHKHNHALRLVGKAILRDLWVEARRLKEGSE